MAALSLAVAFAVSLAWCSTALWLGPRSGFIDRPDNPSLKIHLRPAVPLGGIGIFAGIHLGLAVLDRLDSGLFAGTAILLVIGLADDRWTLPPAVRLGAEIAAAVVLVWAAYPNNPGWIIWLLAVIGVVITVNAVNLFDGLDGLAAVGAGVASLGIGWLATTNGRDPTTTLLLAAGLAGFLVLNRSPARVFLGDNGAYAVGGFLAFSVLVASPTGAVNDLMVAAVPIGVILFDTAVAVIRRFIGRRPLFSGDRSHLYDQLRDRGWSVGRIVGTTAVTQVAFAIIARALELAPASLTPWLVLLLATTGLGMLWRLGFITRGAANTSPQ